MSLRSAAPVSFPLAATVLRATVLRATVLRATVLLATVLLAGALRAERMTPELLWKIGRVSDGCLSPDGAGVAYTVRRYELVENVGTSELRVVGVDGGGDREIASGLASLGDLEWSSDGARIWAIVKPSKEDDPQVWTFDVRSGERHQVTKVEGGVGNLHVSPRGDRIAFSVTVPLDPQVKDLHPDLPKAEAKIIDSLMFRHWNAWRDGSYSHVCVAPIGSDGTAGPHRDLMAGLRVDCPVPPFGGREQYAWSPDGEEIAFTAKIVRRWAESTDSDVYLADLAGDERLLCATAERTGYDNDPVYSPDGRYIAIHSMERAGFEADRNRIFLFDRATRESHEITTGLDQTAHGATWSPDSETIWFYSERQGTDQIFALDVRSRELSQVTEGRYNWAIADVASDGARLLVTRTDMIHPAELYVIDLETREARAITRVHESVYAGLELPTIEERHVRSTDGKKVQNWVIYPPDFDPSKRWPLLTYCQGGPQGQIGQWFSYRWNFHLMAANGYVVLAVNRRGLPGFGREWNDQISRDWGGQAMQDILAATDSMLTEPYIDPDRVGAVGASFGGYTVYWLMGHHEGRFSAMIAHCGVFNLESMYGSTEELFFVNWDLGGPYWRSEEIAADYRRFSPHRFVGRWQTPLLVVHGEKDFRVPVTQGIEAFTAAQVEGVPSRFLYFPAEGHWVLSPQNGVLWHRVFFEWLERWCGSKSTP